MDELLQETLAYLQSLSDKLGFILNPDEKTLHRIAAGMAANLSRYGKRYCPCKQHYPLDAALDPVCPCPEFRDEIKRDGHCECHVFWEAAAAAEAKRRPGLLATITCPG